MECEKCGRDTDLWICLPIYQPDGRLNTMVCQSCAQKSDAYCYTHDLPHIGFCDGTHACIGCINDAFRLRGEQLGHQFLSEIDVQSERWWPIFDWADGVAELTNEFYYPIIGRAIITLAQRLGQKEEDIIHEIFNHGPNFLLHHSAPDSGTT